ncbi:MAG TPA: FtsQ-type POTRA domain-containing protein [Thermoanaerobaculia bacterium]|nr:FtsQ-type POTRA domain-containing protein [Thermoanaerobaculia bacterium]
MTVHHTAPGRFFRPIDLGTTPRNYRKLQARRLLAALANLLFFLALALGGFWLWRKTQEDSRFAIRRIEIAGIVHAPRAGVESLVNRWSGANLFRLDLEQLRAELRANPWIESVSLQKKLPDTLEVALTERRPVALVDTGAGGLRYVDRHGVVFADLSPAIGDPDLPVVVRTQPESVAAAVEFLERLRRDSPELHSRVSQASANRSEGFTVWDRELGTVLRLGRGDEPKWTALHGIARADGWRAGTIAYADLRFRDRIVIMPENRTNEHAERSNAPR